MSLTSELRHKDSLLAQFFRQTFPNTRGSLAEIREALRSREPICELREEEPPFAHSIVGMAVDYRIRYSFAPTPTKDLVAWRGASAVSDRLRPEWQDVEYDETPPADSWIEADANPQSVAYEYRVRSGSVQRREWLGRLTHEFEDAPRLPEAALSGFFDLLDQTIERLAPHCQWPSPDDERGLARLCLLLATFESVSRAGSRAWPPSFLGRELPQSASELLASVPDSWIEDVAALASALSRRHSAWLGAPAMQNPTFAGSRDVGGADTDFILTGCLWDIKTTKRSGGDSNWLYQLLGYVLLDYDDDFKIESVGLLLPRQDTSLRWPLSGLIEDLSGRRDLGIGKLRRDFRAAVTNSR